MTEPFAKLNDPDDLGPIDQDNPPSWFTRTYGKSDLAEQYRSHRPSPPIYQPIIAENTAAYEAYRKRLEDRFLAAQQTIDPRFKPQDNDVSAQAFPTRPAYVHNSLTQQPTTSKRPFGFHAITLTFLAITACGIGGGAGFLAANPDLAKSLYTNSYATMMSFVAGPSTPTITQTVITKKTIPTAKLEVSDAEGAVNTPIALDISALPADAAAPVALRITGLPPAAYLTKGVEISEGEWLLKAADMAQAELVVPHSNTTNLALQVFALEEKTGAPAAPGQDLKIKLDLNAVPAPGVPTENVVIMPANALPNQGFNTIPQPSDQRKPR